MAVPRLPLPQGSRNCLLGRLALTGRFHQSDGTTGSIVRRGITTQLIVVGTGEYVKAPAAFYVAQKESPAVAARVANRWVQVRSDAGLGDLTLAAFSKSLAKPATDSTASTLKVKTGKVSGQSVVIVTKPDGSQLFVAAKGKPFPMKIVDTAKNPVGSRSYHLSGYGQRITIRAPSGVVAVAGSATAA
jgi:hypothetical protein